MIFNKKINEKIEVPYFFYEGKFEKIDSNYFIEKINEGIKLYDNQSHKTNISGFMTAWNFFDKDIELDKLLWPILDVVDSDIQKQRYFVRESWGFKLGMGNYTSQHNHTKDNIFASGVIYLNEHEQLLEFKDIGKKIKPEVGTVALFSSFLNHGCIRNTCEKEKYGISFNLELKL